MASRGGFIEGQRLTLLRTFFDTESIGIKPWYDPMPFSNLRVQQIDQRSSPVGAR